MSVGAMKAGTTFLFNAFNNHPDIYFTPEKELHYFAHTQGLCEKLQKPLLSRLITRTHKVTPGSILTHEFRRHRLATVMRNRFSQLRDADRLREIVKWYADWYLRDPIDAAWLDGAFSEAGERWAADFSNYNALLSDAGWKAVRQHCGQLRVIYVMREPVERLWSHIKFELLPAGQRDALISGDLTLVDTFLASSSSAHARYRDIIQSLTRNLEPHELRVVRLEDILDNPNIEMNKIADFLQIRQFDWSFVNPKTRVNKTEGLEIPAASRARLHQAVTSEYPVYNQKPPA